MDYIAIWDDLLRSYKKLNRYNLFKRKNSKNILFYSLIVYTILSIASLLFFSRNHYFIMAIVIYTSAISINYYLNKQLSILYGYSHNIIPLKDHEKIIRYNEFRRIYKQKEDVYGKRIDKIIKWHLILSKKEKKYNIFTSSISMLVLSMILSLLSRVNVFDNNEFQVSIILSVIYLFLLQFIYLINDLLTSKKRKLFEISRYLEWIQLEK